MVESTALEMRRAREGTQGSNPCLSANQSLIAETRADTSARMARISAIPYSFRTTESFGGSHNAD